MEIRDCPAFTQTSRLSAHHGPIKNYPDQAARQLDVKVPFGSTKVMLKRLRQVVLRLMPSQLAGRLRSWRIKQIIRDFNPRVVRHRYGGRELDVYLADPLARGWYDQDWEDLPEITFLRNHGLKNGARVFDLGAHQGVIAMLLACETGPSGKVVALEAIKHNCDVALRNKDLNRLSQIEVIHAAVADHCGRIQFNVQLNGQLDDGTGRAGRTEVEAITIDALTERYGIPDLVFLDVEGAEQMALAGASRTLAQKPDFFVEVHVQCGLEKLGGSVAGVLAYFPTTDFSLFGRGQNEGVFQPFKHDDLITSDRFFLIALARHTENAA